MTFLSAPVGLFSGPPESVEPEFILRDTHVKCQAPARIFLAFFAPSGIPCPFPRLHNRCPNPASSAPRNYARASHVQSSGLSIWFRSAVSPCSRITLAPRWCSGWWRCWG